MKPKKARLLYEELSEEIDLPKDLIESIVDFYYKNVRTLLSELHHPRINITGLGLFIVRSKSIKDAIPRVEKYLRNHDTSSYSAYYNMKMLEKKLGFLYSMSDQIKVEKERKEKFLEKKRGLKKNLEK